MPKPITLDLINHLIGISSPGLSPDGRRLAFVKSRIDLDDSEKRSQIQTLELSNGDLVTFTQGTEVDDSWH